MNIEDCVQDCRNSGLTSWELVAYDRKALHSPHVRFRVARLNTDMSEKEKSPSALMPEIPGNSC